jgi:dUTP pyrophosphatase
MKFLKTRDVKDPSRGTPQSAGIDLFIPNDFAPQNLLPGDSVLIPAGLKINIPENHVFIMMNKSGVATKRHLDVGACVIDEDYQGEIHIHLINVGNRMTTVLPGEKIAQCLLMPIVYASVELVDDEEHLWDGKSTERGDGGFGSTGVN